MRNKIESIQVQSSKTSSLGEGEDRESEMGHFYTWILFTNTSLEIETKKKSLIKFRFYIHSRFFQFSRNSNQERGEHATFFYQKLSTEQKKKQWKQSQCFLFRVDWKSNTSNRRLLQLRGFFFLNQIWPISLSLSVAKHTHNKEKHWNRKSN